MPLYLKENDPPLFTRNYEDALSVLYYVSSSSEQKMKAIMRNSAKFWLLETLQGDALLLNVPIL